MMRFMQQGKLSSFSNDQQPIFGWRAIATTCNKRRVVVGHAAIVLLKIHSTICERFHADVATGYKQRQTRTSLTN